MGKNAQLLSNKSIKNDGTYSPNGLSALTAFQKCPHFEIVIVSSFL